MGYRNHAYLLKHIVSKEGRFLFSITLDTGEDAVWQAKIREKVAELVTEGLLTHHGVAPKPEGAYFEVITGSTANRLEQMADLLEHARNLLLEVGPRVPSMELVKLAHNLAAEIDTELR